MKNNWKKLKNYWKIIEFKGIRNRLKKIKSQKNKMIS